MPADTDPELLATWRAQVLDARIAVTTARPPAEQLAACAAWLDEALPKQPTSAIGVGGIPEAWLDTLAWCGLPLAAGPLRWGVDIAQTDVDTPTVRQGRLLLPPPDTLASLTSLALKPMRMFIGDRLGCRLQAAPGIRMWLWEGRAVLQSQSPIPLAGFFYGPLPGHRAGLAIEPWGSQIVTW